MPLTRRQLLQSTAAIAVAAPVVLPRHVLGGPKFVAPSEKVNIAIVGAGGQGRTNVRALLQLPDAQIISIADPIESVNLDRFYFKGVAGRGPVKAEIEKHFREKMKIKDYTVSTHEDFRVMIEKEKSIDAVLCATPDHNHAYVSIAAMRAGKHTFCEKPLTHNIREARLVAQVAKETGVATQMGNMGHSSDGIRQTVEFIRDGAIGAIKHVDAWVPTKRWNPTLQGVPKDPCKMPDEFNWDLWLGVRPERPYHDAYVPVSWRDFWAFGCGALGDFGCHDLDSATWAFDLQPPTSVEPLTVGYTDTEIGPYGEICYYQFDVPGRKDPLHITWYSGGIRPQRPAELPLDRAMDSRGVMFTGEKGVILCGGAGGPPRIFPDELRANYKIPAPSLKRVKGHHRDWLDAIKGGDPASSNFQYGARLTEITLLGVLAIRMGKRITWDAAGMKCKTIGDSPNSKDNKKLQETADAIIHGVYRKGWEVM